MGYLVVVERFVKIMAMVWAGSQVTKLVRARGALALAPIVDKDCHVTFPLRPGSHGDCRILFWASSHSILHCNIALGMAHFSAFFLVILAENLFH
ncbi:hypothetical protein CK203_115391 [Vitis vinifera]|uniref:Uncharacterized protein n=1 Tax=Vitis vinifera TaxID=29760 RepID=A0A438FFL3_VITVI|nr:hypothetical protein CK203_115391 [Vitis vinifera]